MMQPFTPLHINLSAPDLSGNGGRGRYILLPGSDGRAAQFAEHFQQVEVKRHPRGHHAYLGKLDTLDVLAISTGMGCASAEIILHELFMLGGRRFLRVGTTGTLQPNHVKIGELINVTAAVRDESTTQDYVPAGFPALASIDMVNIIRHAAKKIQLSTPLHQGIVHCKASFYAREFGEGPLAAANQQYMDTLAQCGVLASEMETAALFVQGSVYAQRCLSEATALPAVLTGAILGVVACGLPPYSFADDTQQKSIITNILQLALASLRELARVDDMEHA